MGSILFCKLLILFGVYVYGFFNFVSAERRLSPVIFVPGYGGSQVIARLNKNYAPVFYCWQQTDWYNKWLNLDLLTAFSMPCWVDNSKLHYSPKTRETVNTQGVEINIPGWGSSEVVEWIDPTHNTAGAYFVGIANMLLNMGYQRLKNIRGAPYDFRKAPNEHKLFFIKLKKLVEDTYEMNDQTPITFITHSMGSLMTLVFLQQQTTEWKRKYIKRKISLAGAWAGSVKALKVFAMGDDLDSLFLYSSLMKPVQISNPSTAWLLPSPFFWRPSEILVETPSRVYTMAHLQDFFKDINYPNGWEMRQDNLQYTINFSPPDVELHCLYGDDLNTVERLRYEKDTIANETPNLIMGIGDGTVNQRSLRACHSWIGYQTPKIINVPLSGVGHMQILVHSDVLIYIKNLLAS